MKKLSTLIIFGAMMCGFMMPETCTQRREREGRERTWAKTVADRYDMRALSAFVKETVAKTKTWNGADLLKTDIAADWKFTGTALVSGDWSFESPDPSTDVFTLSFIYSSHGKRWLILKCMRDSRKSFRLLEITSEEVIILNI
jgi:hypothetical protein